MATFLFVLFGKQKKGCGTCVDENVETVLGLQPANGDNSGSGMAQLGVTSTSVWSFDGRIGRGTFQVTRLSLLVGNFVLGVMLEAIG